MNSRQNSEAFTRIYRAAKQLNQGFLLQLYRQYKTMDVKDYAGFFTPASWLALEGHHQAVALLQQYGASDDYIAMAYASRGRVKDAEKLRKFRGVNLKLLAIGAAMWKDNTYAEWLRQKYNLPLDWLTFGAAYAKQYQYTDWLVSEASRSTSDVEDESYIAVEVARLNGLKLSGQKQDCNYIYGSQENPVVKARLHDVLKPPARGKNVEDNSILPPFFKKHDLCLRETVDHDNRNDVMTWMINNDYFYHPLIVIYELAFIENEAFLSELCAAAKTIFENDKNGFLAPMLGEDHYYNSLLKHFSENRNTASKLQTLMQKYQFNIDQAEVFLSSKYIRDIMKITAFTGAKLALAVCIIRKGSSLDCEDTQDMLEKYMLFHAKNYVAKQLDDLYNKHYSSWNVMNNSAQKLDRVQSLSVAAKNANSFNELIELPLEQYRLFSGLFKPKANPQLPKHKQPLSKNDSECDLTLVIDNLLTCARLNRVNLPRK